MYGTGGRKRAANATMAVGMRFSHRAQHQECRCENQCARWERGEGGGGRGIVGAQLKMLRPLAVALTPSLGPPAETL